MQPPLSSIRAHLEFSSYFCHGLLKKSVLLYCFEDTVFYNKTFEKPSIKVQLSRKIRLLLVLTRSYFINNVPNNISIGLD
jgi:hypothetical protein